ncbi:unnamed protein product [Prorocentrum cordatum]|uniref:Nudix hydrolase domain-containing protein n=1 Tax=Prorocentrum cordatum TaxID=2364126 RepID=A0ABN9VLW9_9DINO|nr:unnamed protein product [Polarella glacialis]
MPAGPPAERGELPDWLQNEAKLSEYLRGRGVSTERLGTGAAKCCADLLHELRAGACHLEAREADGAAQVLRIVEPVFIRLRWGARVLVQEAQLRPDGRTAKRKMLLAEKKEPRDGGGLFATIVRGINEELGVPQDILQQEGVLHYRQDTYHFEVEQIDSPSYPGLMSMYRTHHVQVDIQEAGLQHFAGLGLPDGTDFATTETTAVGTTTHFWKWYDIAEALACHVVKFPPPLMSSSVLLAPPADGAAAAACQGGAAVALTAEALPDEEALAERLARAGIDVEKYGVGKAKSVAQLLKELRGGESVLEWSEDTRQLRRVVEPVFLQVRWRNSVLVEVEQKFADGRTRNRNMLLAEKKSPKDADVRATAFRGIREELDLPDDFPQLDTVCRFMQEAYCCVAENMESASYPGLPCVYVTHYCGVQICETALQLFEEQGCLADTFTTTEADKTNVWRWMPVDEARGNKVKGFPATKHEDADTVSYKALDRRPWTEGLRVLLEMGAVNVSAWGEFTMASLKSLARELKTGNAHLERDGRTGRLRRVMKSSVLHLMVDEPSGSLSPGLRPVDCAPAFSLEDAREMVHYRPDLTCFEVVYPDTASYPGLPCCQQTNLVQFEGSLAGKVGRTARTACVGRDLDDGQGLPATAPEKPIDGAGSDQLRAGPRLMDEAVAAGRLREGSCEGVKSVSSISSADTGSASRGLRSVDDGHPMSPQKGSVALPLSPQRRSRGPEDGVPRRTLWGQVRSLQQNLRFKMVAKESQGAPATPAEQAVSCACDMILIRNINPLNATFQCRFTIYLEWLDKAAVGLPVGEVPEDRKKQISVPEIALQAGGGAAASGAARAAARDAVPVAAARAAAASAPPAPPARASVAFHTAERLWAAAPCVTANFTATMFSPYAGAGSPVERDENALAEAARAMAWRAEERSSGNVATQYDAELAAQLTGGLSITNSRPATRGAGGGRPAGPRRLPERRPPCLRPGGLLPLGEGAAPLWARLRGSAAAEPPSPDGLGAILTVQAVAWRLRRSQRSLSASLKDMSNASAAGEIEELGFTSGTCVQRCGGPGGTWGGGGAGWFLFDMSFLVPELPAEVVATKCNPMELAAAIQCFRWPRPPAMAVQRVSFLDFPWVLDYILATRFNCSLKQIRHAVCSIVLTLRTILSAAVELGILVSQDADAMDGAISAKPFIDNMIHVITECLQNFPLCLDSEFFHSFLEPLPSHLRFLCGNFHPLTHMQFEHAAKQKAFEAQTKAITQALSELPSQCSSLELYMSSQEGFWRQVGLQRHP